MKVDFKDLIDKWPSSIVARSQVVYSVENLIAFLEKRSEAVE